MWHVYIVRCADQSLYTGIARDLDARIGQHNAGTGSAYTRSRRPVELVHCEPAEDRSAAQRREAAIKRMPVSLKRSLIQAGK
ncbi:MAG: GIY-YIG nuclease family protein [Gammaproteobacteria bacterium]